jgi:hypothetical protein
VTDRWDEYRVRRDDLQGGSFVSGAMVSGVSYKKPVLFNSRMIQFSHRDHQIDQLSNYPNNQTYHAN